MGSTLSFRIGMILLGGFVLMQLLLVVALQLPGRGSTGGTYGLPTPPAIAEMVRAIDEAGPARADRLVSSYNGSLFTVEIVGSAPADFREVPPSLEPLARGYRQALADHNVVVDGGPGRLNGFLGERARPVRFLVPIRVTVWLRDGRVLVLTGRPSAALRAYLTQRSLLGLVAGAALLLVLWLAVRQTTGPLRRLAASVRALGEDLRAPDAKAEGSAETRALAQAFNDMKGRIAGLVDERTFILAGVAHDMRTYLTRLRLRADFIADQGQRAKAEQDLDQMSTLLDDNLLFAGIDRTSMTRLKPIDLGAATRDFAEARVDGERVKVTGGDGGTVLADRAGLERIFGNLVDNALRHATEVAVSIRSEDGQLLWCFDDDGPGVSSDDLPQLGRAYLRLDPSRDRRTGGAGLGLAIVRALAEAMGGNVRFAQSDRGGLRACVALKRA